MSPVAENISSEFAFSSLTAALLTALKFLLVSVVFSSFLIPTAIVLFVFSTPLLRRRISFILNVCAIGFGLTQGCITAYVTIREMVLKPPDPALISVITALYIVGPTCVQTILFLRVLAVYPPHQLSLCSRFLMYGPAIALKAARVTNAGYLLYTIQSSTRGPKSILGEAATVWSSPFAKLDFFLQLLDDVYMSTAFLLRLHTRVKFLEKQPAPKGPHTPLSAASYAARVRTLFWIALSNFVFPVVFDVAQLVLIFRDPSYVDGGYVISINSYVSILGVLFSTIWSGSHRVAETATSSSSPQPVTSLSVCSHCQCQCQCRCCGGGSSPYRSTTSLTARCLPRPPTPLPLRADLGRLGSGPDSSHFKGGFAPTSSRTDVDAVGAEDRSAHGYGPIPHREFTSRFAVTSPQPSVSVRSIVGTGGGTLVGTREYDC